MVGEAVGFELGLWLSLVKVPLRGSQQPIIFHLFNKICFIAGRSFLELKISSKRLGALAICKHNLDPILLRFVCGTGFSPN